jgi:DNA-binding transcriptional LysR family regulator
MLKPFFESDQFSSIFPLVASGFGVSIIPEMAAPLATGCRVVPLGPASVRRVGYFRNRRCFSSKAAKAFVSWLRTVAQEQGQEPVRSRSKEFIPAGAMSTN